MNVKLETVKGIKISPNLPAVSINHNRLSKQLQIQTNPLEKRTNDTHRNFPEEVVKMADEHIRDLHCN